MKLAVFALCMAVVSLAISCFVLGHGIGFDEGEQAARCEAMNCKAAGYVLDENGILKFTWFTSPHPKFPTHEQIEAAEPLRDKFYATHRMEPIGWWGDWKWVKK